MIGIRGVSVVALLVVVFESVGRAEPDEPRDPIAAEALFQHGKDLMDHGHIPEACRAFAESQRLDPAGGTLLRLALCHEAERKLASAWVEYLEVMRMSQEGGGEPTKLAERIRIVREHLEAIEPRVPKLVVEVPPESRVGGLRVTVNGQSRAEGSWGVAIPIDPGEVTIAATAPGRRTFQTTLRVEEGGQPRVEVPPVDTQVAPTRVTTHVLPAGPVKTESSALQPLGLGLGAVGLASLGAGAYFGLRAISKWNDANGQCPQTMCAAPAVVLAHDAKQSATIADVTIGVGAVAIAAGLALYIVGSPRNLTVQAQSVAISF